MNELINWPINHCVFVSWQARFDAGELITQRELVSRQVSEDLTERASTFGLILDDVSLVWSCWKILQQCPYHIFTQILTWRNNCNMFFQTHLTFGKEFTEAVEMKQVAQQEAERARFVVEKVLFWTHRSSMSSQTACAFRTFECDLCEEKGGRMWVTVAHKIFFLPFIGRATKAGGHHFSRGRFPSCLAHRQLPDGSWWWSGRAT